MSDNLIPTQSAARIDDCWNRIGVRGDKSCERLVEHVHCRNCEVHAAAVIHLLERYAAMQDDVELVVDEPLVEHCSLLLFRVAEEWLAIATRSLVEVVAQLPVHSLPHQRSRSLLGVANVRGTLMRLRGTRCSLLCVMVGWRSVSFPAGCFSGRGAVLPSLTMSCCVRP